MAVRPKDTAPPKQESWRNPDEPLRFSSKTTPEMRFWWDKPWRNALRGFTCTLQKDGEQALQCLQGMDFKPDLIILDLNIPKMSGYAVLALNPLKKTTPVVVFSASENEEDVNRSFALGALEFIHKPMDLDDYKNAVTGMVGKWARNR
jgi:CheY-like chemotaxis protein